MHCWKDMGLLNRYSTRDILSNPKSDLEHANIPRILTAHFDEFYELQFAIFEPIELSIYPQAPLFNGFIFPTDVPISLRAGAKSSES